MTEQVSLQPVVETCTFDVKKREYFISLGLATREAFALHRRAGLWDRTPEGTRDWGNVSEHCLVEVARVSELGNLLDLPLDLQADLMHAAALHDFGKKIEKETAAQYDFSWEGFDRAGERAEVMMREAGFSDQVINLATAVGHTSLERTEELLHKPQLSDEDLAFLVMHYVDDYTINSDWVSDHGDPTQAFEARMRKNEAHPRYQRLNEEGRARFGGRTTFQAQREIGLAVQDRLNTEIIKRTPDLASIRPKQLPSLVDALIVGRIQQN